MNLNDISIGVDIEENSRFANLDMKNNAGFLENIFTNNELDYCFSKKDSAQHLAVRFSAKEAIIKAISGLGDKAPTFNTIEVRREGNGVPSVQLQSYDIKISLSHSREASIAMALVTKVD